MSSDWEACFTNIIAKTEKNLEGKARAPPNLRDYDRAFQEFIHDPDLDLATKLQLNHYQPKSTVTKEQLALAKLTSQYKKLQEANVRLRDELSFALESKTAYLNQLTNKIKDEITTDIAAGDLRVHAEVKIWIDAVDRRVEESETKVARTKRLVSDMQQSIRDIDAKTSNRIHESQSALELVKRNLSDLEKQLHVFHRETESRIDSQHLSLTNHFTAEINRQQQERSSLRDYVHRTVDDVKTHADSLNQLAMKTIDERIREIADSIEDRIAEEAQSNCEKVESQSQVLVAIGNRVLQLEELQTGNKATLETAMRDTYSKTTEQMKQLHQLIGELEAAQARDKRDMTETLEREALNTQARLETMRVNVANEMSELRRELRADIARMMSEETADMKRKLTDVVETQRKQLETIGEQRTLVNDVQSQVSKLSTEISTAQSNESQMRSRMELQLQSRIASCESANRQQITDVDTKLNRQITQQSSTIEDKLRRLLSDSESRLEQTITDLTNRHTASDTKASQLTNTVEQLQRRVSGHLSSEWPQLSRNVDQLRASVEGIEQDSLSKLTTQLTQQSTAVENLRKQSKDDFAVLSQLRSQFVDSMTEVKELQSQQSITTSAISQLRQQLSDNTSSTATQIRSLNSEYADSIAQLRSRIEDSAVGVLQQIRNELAERIQNAQKSMTETVTQYQESQTEDNERLTERINQQAAMLETLRGELGAEVQKLKETPPPPPPQVRPMEDLELMKHISDVVQQQRSDIETTLAEYLSDQKIYQHKSHESLIQSVNELRKEITELRSSIPAVAAEEYSRNDVDSRLAEITSQINRLSSRIDDMQRTIPEAIQQYHASHSLRESEKRRDQFTETLNAEMQSTASQNDDSLIQVTNDNAVQRLEQIVNTEYYQQSSESEEPSIIEQLPSEYHAFADETHNNNTESEEPSLSEHEPAAKRESADGSDSESASSTPSVELSFEALHSITDTTPETQRPEPMRMEVDDEPNDAEESEYRAQGISMQPMELVLEPDSDSEPEPEPHQQPEAESEPKSEPTPDSESDSESESESEPEPTPQPAQIPQAQSAAEPLHPERSSESDSDSELETQYDRQQDSETHPGLRCTPLQDEQQQPGTEPDGDQHLQSAQETEANSELNNNSPEPETEPETEPEREQERESEPEVELESELVNGSNTNQEQSEQFAGEPDQEHTEHPPKQECEQQVPEQVLEQEEPEQELEQETEDHETEEQEQEMEEQEPEPETELQKQDQEPEQNQKLEPEADVEPEQVPEQESEQESEPEQPEQPEHKQEAEAEQDNEPEQQENGQKPEQDQSETETEAEAEADADADADADAEAEQPQADPEQELDQEIETEPEQEKEQESESETEQGQEQEPELCSDHEFETGTEPIHQPDAEPEESESTSAHEPDRALEAKPASDESACGNRAISAPALETDSAFESASMVQSDSFGLVDDDNDSISESPTKVSTMEHSVQRPPLSPLTPRRLRPISAIGKTSPVGPFSESPRTPSSGAPSHATSPDSTTPRSDGSGSDSMMAAGATSEHAMSHMSGGSGSIGHLSSISALSSTSSSASDMHFSHMLHNVSALSSKMDDTLSTTRSDNGSAGSSDSGTPRPESLPLEYDTETADVNQPEAEAQSMAESSEPSDISLRFSYIGSADTSAIDNEHVATTNNQAIEEPLAENDEADEGDDSDSETVSSPAVSIAMSASAIATSPSLSLDASQPTNDHSNVGEDIRQSDADNDPAPVEPTTVLEEPTNESSTEENDIHTLSSIDMTLEDVSRRDTTHDRFNSPSTSTLPPPANESNTGETADEPETSLQLSIATVNDVDITRLTAITSLTSSDSSGLSSIRTTHSETPTDLNTSSSYNPSLSTTASGISALADGMSGLSSFGSDETTSTGLGNITASTEKDLSSGGSADSALIGSDLEAYNDGHVVDAATERGESTGEVVEAEGPRNDAVTRQTPSVDSSVNQNVTATETDSDPSIWADISLPLDDSNQTLPNRLADNKLSTPITATETNQSDAPITESGLEAATLSNNPPISTNTQPAYNVPKRMFTETLDRTRPTTSDSGQRDPQPRRGPRLAALLAAADEQIGVFDEAKMMKEFGIDSSDDADDDDDDGDSDDNNEIAASLATGGESAYSFSLGSHARRRQLHLEPPSSSSSSNTKTVDAPVSGGRIRNLAALSRARNSADNKDDDSDDSNNDNNADTTAANNKVEVDSEDNEFDDSNGSDLDVSDLLDF